MCILLQILGTPTTTTKTIAAPTTVSPSNGNNNILCY